MNQFGCIPSGYDVRDYKLNIADDSVPRQFEYPVLGIKNQKDTPRCTVFASSELVEYCYYRINNQYIKFSTDFIYAHKDDDTPGMKIRDALKVLQIYGDVPDVMLSGNHDSTYARDKVEANKEYLYPLAESHRISAYFKLVSIEDVKYAICSCAPVIAGMHWCGGTIVDRYGQLSYDVTAGYTNHAVLIIGYNSIGFVVQNSWGKAWGKDGTFLIPYQDYYELVFEAYGVTNNMEIIKYPKIKNKILYITINKIVNGVKHLWWNR